MSAAGQGSSGRAASAVVGVFRNGTGFFGCQNSVTKCVNELMRWTRSAVLLAASFPAARTHPIQGEVEDGCAQRDVVHLNLGNALLAHSNLGGLGGPEGSSLLFPGEPLDSASSHALVFANVGTVQLEAAVSASFNLEVHNTTSYSTANGGASNGLRGAAC